MAENDSLPGAGVRAGGILRRGLSSVFNGAKSAKLRMEITSLNGHKQDRFAEIGKKVYALYESGLVRNAELLDLCGQIRQVDYDILERERELALLRSDESPGAMPPAPYEGGIDDPSDRSL